jgi:hypothetical protein
MRDYYNAELAAGRSNTGVIATLAALRSAPVAGSVSYVNTVDQWRSIQYALDIWNVPNKVLLDYNEPRLAPGLGGPDTPTLWRAYLDWLHELPPQTASLAVVVPPLSADSWRSIGGSAEWSTPDIVRGSDGTPVAAILRRAGTVADALAARSAQLGPRVLIVVPTAADLTYPYQTANLPRTEDMRLLVLGETEADSRAATTQKYQPAFVDQLLSGGYPVDYLGWLAPSSGAHDREAAWTDPATGQTATASVLTETLHHHLFGVEGPLSAATLRSDLRGVIALYKPARILTVAPDSADPVEVATAQAVQYAARKAGVPVEILR